MDRVVNGDYEYKKQGNVSRLSKSRGGTDLIFQISLAPPSIEANVPPNKQLRTISWFD